MTKGKVARNVLDLGFSRPKSLAVLVAERLRDAILNAELALGQMLSEEQIATTMNVSRTPVREALTMLQLQGLIEIRPQRGSFVFQPDPADIVEVVQFRHLMETAAAQASLKNNPAETIIQLENALTIMEAARDANDLLAFARGDSAFHEALFAHCGNRYVSEAYSGASGRLAALRAHLAGPLMVHRSRAHPEHVEMLNAARSGNIGSFLEILSQHILAMTDNYIGALKLKGQ